MEKLDEWVLDREREHVVGIRVLYRNSRIEKEVSGVQRVLFHCTTRVFLLFALDSV